jgi:hypothetical protein
MSLSQRSSEAPRHRRCGAQTLASGACGIRTDQHPSQGSHAHTAASTGAKRTHKPGQHLNPGIMADPGIPAQQVQRTDTHRRACKNGTSWYALTKHAHTHTRKQQRRAHTQPGTFLPASCRTMASRHSRCSTQASASGLAGAERTKTHSQSTRNAPQLFIVCEN